MSSSSGNSSSWFFNIEPESPSEGLMGLNPFSKNLFRSVLRKFAGKTTTTSDSSSPSSSSIPLSSPNSEYQRDGAQSQGLVPVEGAVSSFRCGGINFGVHAVEVRQQSNESSSATTTQEENSTATDNNNRKTNTTTTSSEKEVTFNITCASLESANHGLCVGLSLADTNRESPMQWDEPNTCFLSCSVDGATFWSEHLGEYGKKVSDKCLFKENNNSGDQQQQSSNQQPQKYVGKVQMKWNVENGSVSFDVFDESRKEIIANCTRDYFSKKSKYSAESSEEAIKELLPTVAFSTVVNEDMVTLS